MATVVDALVVTLGLDPAKYKRGTKEAEKTQQEFSRKTQDETRKRERMEKRIHTEQKKNNREFVRQGKEAVDIYRKIRNEALGVLAVFGAGVGMIEFAKHTITGAANVSLLSKNLGMSAKQVAGYQGAVEALGGSAADANSLLSQAATSVANLQNGLPPTHFLTEYRKFGGQLRAGDLRDPQMLLEDVSGFLHQYAAQHGRRQSWDVAKDMGLSDAQFNLLVKGPGGMGHLVNEMARYSSVSNQNAAAAQKLRIEWQKMSATLGGIIRKIVLHMEPVFRMLLGQLQKFANWANSHQAEIQQFIQKLVKGFGDLVPKLETAARDLSQFVKQFDALVKEISKAMGYLHIHTKKSDTKLGPESPGIKHYKQTRNNVLESILFGLHVFDPGSSANNDFTSWLSSHWNGAPSPVAALSMIRNLDRLAAGRGGSYMNNSHNTTNSSEAHFGQVTIQTRATDAQGIFNEIGPALNLFPFVPQSDGASK